MYVHSAPKPDPISVLWTTRQRPVNTRQKIAVTIGISMKASKLVATKEPWDIHLRAKILAEDMGLEPTGLLRLTWFPIRLLSHSVNPPRLIKKIIIQPDYVNISGTCLQLKEYEIFTRVKTISVFRSPEL